MQEIVSSQENYPALPSNSDRKLFSNPSFSHGFLTDIEFVVPPEEGEDDDDSLNEDDEPPTQAETFSLIKLVTGIVKREVDPLRKELEDMKKLNQTLKEEIEALKLEQESVAITPAIAPSTEQMNIVLAPYKDALEKISPIEKSLANQQRYLDQDDAKKREKNVVITGVKEATEDDDDTSTVKEIFEAAGCSDVNLVKVCRLGKLSDNQDRNRPILVTTDSVGTKKKILEKKSELKNNEDERFKTIYIKADETLAVRREWKRLKEVLKKEKRAPTNVGVNLKIDYRTRKLLRDGTVIDEFKSPFHKRGPNL